jgi:hypothetical protein
MATWSLLHITTGKPNTPTQPQSCSQQNFHRFPHSLHNTNVVIGSSADLQAWYINKWHSS